MGQCHLDKLKPDRFINFNYKKNLCRFYKSESSDGVSEIITCINLCNILQKIYITILLPVIRAIKVTIKWLQYNKFIANIFIGQFYKLSQRQVYSMPKLIREQKYKFLPNLHNLSNSVRMVSEASNSLLVGLARILNSGSSFSSKLAKPKANYKLHYHLRIKLVLMPLKDLCGSLVTVFKFC